MALTPAGATARDVMTPSIHTEAHERIMSLRLARERELLPARRQRAPLARNAGKRTIGVVLSGLLKDGTLGLSAIKEAGGIALVRKPNQGKRLRK